MLELIELNLSRNDPEYLRATFDTSVRKFLLQSPKLEENVLYFTD